MPGERAAAADNHRRSGLSGRILRPGRLRRGLLRSARPAAGVGLPARVRLDPDRRRIGLRAPPAAAGLRLPAAVPSHRPALLPARHPAALLPARVPSGLARRPDDLRAPRSAAADLSLRDSSGVERRRLRLRRQSASADPCPNGQPNWRNGQWACLPPPPRACPDDERPQWINGKMICGVPHLPGGPTPCPPGFLPSRQGGPACIPARNPVPGATLAPPIFRTPTPTPTLTLPPKFTPLPTLSPAPLRCRRSPGRSSVRR